MAFCCTCAFVWAAVAVAAYLLYKKFFRSSSSEPTIRKTDWKKDTVYLYQFPRPKKLASFSPFCVKLEMFLRINDIKYENCFIAMARSKYGLVPFIELNGVQYADSQLIVEKLKEHFKIKGLEDPREEAFSRSLDRLVDSHTFPLLLKFKVIDHMEESIGAVLKNMNIPEFLLPVLLPLAQFMFKGKVISRVHTMLGPFSDQEFHMLLKKDLDVIRDVLGKKKFLMGDEPTAVDCTVFGQLVTVCFVDIKTEVKRIVRDEYPSIQEYMDRVIAKVFPSEFA